MRPSTTWMPWALGLVLWGVAAGAMPGAALADDLPVFSTGVGDDGLVLPGGTQDPHWDIVSLPSGIPLPAGPAVVAFTPGDFLPSDPAGQPGSAWVAPFSSAGGAWPPGTYVYRTTFRIDDLDPDSAALSLRIAVDNGVVDILVNGASTGLTASGFAAWSAPMTLDAGFVAGENTIDLLVENIGFTPHGLRVEIDGVADPFPAPEPEPEPVPVPEPPAAKPVVELAELGRCHRGGRSFRRGRVLAAVLSSDTFDAATLDLDTVRLGGAEIALACRGRRVAFLRDVDRDGKKDLVFLVWSRDLDADADDGSLSFSATDQDGTDVVGTLSFDDDA